MLSKLMGLLTRPLSRSGPYQFAPAFYQTRGNDWPAEFVPVNHSLVPGLIQGSGWIAANTPTFEHTSLDASGLRPTFVNANVIGNAISVANTPRTAALVLDALMASPALAGKGQYNG